MAKRRGSLERGRVTEQVEKQQTDMHETAEKAEEHVSDTETEHETLERLEGGTAEGADEAHGCIEAAKDASGREFEQLGQGLEQVHTQTEQFEGELHEEAERVDADSQVIDDASGRLHGDTARQELTEASQAKEKDKEFLTSHKERAGVARTESIRLYEEYKNRVNAAKGK
jgi:hypothetical protein